jgi:hypothetical protein
LFHKNNLLDAAVEMAETLPLELTGPFWSNERGDLEVTCSTLKTAKEPLEVFRLSRSIPCREGFFLDGGVNSLECAGLTALWPAVSCHGL